MAMDKSAMAALILSKVGAINSDTAAATPEIQAELEAFCDGIISHILAAAEVTVVVSGGSSSGPQTGTITG